MNIRVLFILLLCAVVVAIHGKYRRTGIGLSAALLIAIAWLGIQTPHQLAAPATSSSIAARSSASVPVSQIELQEVDLQGQGAPWRVIGRLRNLDNAVTVRSVVLAIQRFDCADEQTPDEDCVINWQGEITLDAALPPGKTAVIEQELWSHGAVPRIKGTARLRFNIVRVIAAS